MDKSRVKNDNIYKSKSVKVSTRRKEDATLDLEPENVECLLTDVSYDFSRNLWLEGTFSDSMDNSNFLRTSPIIAL